MNHTLVPDPMVKLLELEGEDRRLRTKPSQLVQTFVRTATPLGECVNLAFLPARGRSNLGTMMQVVLTTVEDSLHLQVVLLREQEHDNQEGGKKGRRGRVYRWILTSGIENKCLHGLQDESAPNTPK